MKEYFTRLFNYDIHTNLLMTEMIINAGSPEEPVRLMAHLLAAQQVWLTRCQGDPFTGVLWPDWKADTFVKIIEENSKGWLNYLESLTPADFNKQIHYKNIKGDEFENKLSDILSHAINHGTHHRAQVGQYLKSGGTDLPFTDYIFYIRQLEQNK
ncbi:MAG: DinB family protein [Mucilaginibacter sp.]